MRILSVHKAVTPSQLLAARERLFDLEMAAYEAEHDYVMVDDLTPEIEARWFAARDAYKAAAYAGVLALIPNNQGEHQ